MIRINKFQALIFIALFLGCDVPSPPASSTSNAVPTAGVSDNAIPSENSLSSQSEQPTSPDVVPDLFESLGDVQDGSLTIHCYGLTRGETRENMIEQFKALVKTMKPGKEVAYIFNIKKGGLEYIEARQSGSAFAFGLNGPMFAQVAYMNQGVDGSRWELNQVNKVADRKFNNRMEPIPLSDYGPTK